MILVEFQSDLEKKPWNRYVQSLQTKSRNTELNWTAAVRGVKTRISGPKN